GSSTEWRGAPAGHRDGQHASSWTAALQPVAPLHERAPRGRVAICAGQIPIHRVGETVVDIEEHARLDRVLDGFVAHARGAEWGQVGGAHLSGRERELLEEAERGAQLRV